MTEKTTFRKNKYGVVKVKVREYNSVNYQNIASTLKSKYGCNVSFDLELQPTEAIKRIFEKIERQLGQNIYFAGCCAEFVGNGTITEDGLPAKTYEYQLNDGSISPVALVKGNETFEAFLYSLLLTQGVKNILNR